jgi:lipopolysaccharide/colanic/teichoic acid biosynthesis glycosyltransferase
MLWQAGMHPPELLREVLRRERARSDRNSHGFSMLLYRVAGRTDATRELVETLARRVRSTDELGWLDDTQVAVILPETSRAGAQRLAEDVERSLGERAVPCKVFTYPGDDLDFVEDSTHGSNGSAHPEADDLRPSSADRRRMAARAGSLVRGGTPAEMETFFLERLPIGKRLIDVAVSACVLVGVSPLLLLSAIAIKLDSPGPILFRQKRAGLGGRPFTIYKLRSMVSGAEARKRELLAMNEAKGPVFKMRNDPRVTRVGRILRKTSLDEFPQFWNVLRGDMTLVGPRPPTLDELPGYDRWQRRRLEVTGGLTCIWQVSGRSLVEFGDWVRMDLRYIERRSPLLDLKLLLLTVPAILTGRGAS